MIVFDEFEKALEEVKIKRKEFIEAENRAKIFASRVVIAGASTKQPVDVEGIIEKIGKGVSIEKIVSEDPLLNEGKIKGYEGEYSEEVRKNAERLKKTVALAIKVLAKGVTGVL